MQVYTAPSYVPDYSYFEVRDLLTLFVAGSIEMGLARDWQAELIQRFDNHDFVVAFNPRRDDWNPEWSQSPTNPQLVQQIDWELDQLDKSDIVFFYIQADTKSPITLLELGREVKSGPDRVVVVCEPGFWREANVHRTCAREGVAVHYDLQSGFLELEQRLVEYK